MGREIKKDQLERRARLRLNRLLKLVSRRALKVDISILSDRGIQQLNRVYRKKDQPTDVLSFEAPEVFRKSGFLGELVLSYDTLMRQAREHAHPPFQELDVLLVHGVLHLQGYDHERSKKEAQKMATRENRLLRALRAQTTSGLISR